jgi:hypothetical protein
MILLHEKMFESRLYFTDKLVGMGARIVLCDPHRAIVSGPDPAARQTVESPDIRAGMAMLLAALCAEGTSTINNAQQIERGYERMEERLGALGARSSGWSLSALRARARSSALIRVNRSPGCLRGSRAGRPRGERIVRARLDEPVGEVMERWSALQATVGRSVSGAWPRRGRCTGPA